MSRNDLLSELDHLKQIQELYQTAQRDIAVLKRDIQDRTTQYELASERAEKLNVDVIQTKRELDRTKVAYEGMIVFFSSVI